MATAAITGITGLAGGHVAHALSTAGHHVVGISRRPADVNNPSIHTIRDLSDLMGMTAALNGCDIVFHFADRANRKTYAERDIGTAAIVLSTIRSACAANGIRRLVVASSVYAEGANPASDRYSRSKRAMEDVGLASSPGEPALILRLPPLYGPGSHGAVGHIARAVARGWPMPFGLSKAPRRFLSLDDLADLCTYLTELDDAAFAGAAGNVWVPVNTQQGSLASLVRSMGKGQAWLLPIPGIDWLIGGRVPQGQLEHDRQALFDAIGWQAKN